MRSIQPAGIQSLAVAVPTDTREITLPSGQSALRHSLPEGTSGLDLEKQAAVDALRLANLEPADVDLVMSASFPALPEPCIGNATPLAWDLGMTKASSYNVESACAGGLVALRNACHEVKLGEYRNVLVTVACPYTPTVEAGHPAYDVIGDAAYAMVVGPTAPGQDFLASVVRNSGPTCPLVSWSVSDKTPSGIRLEVGHKTAGALEAWSMTEIPDLVASLLGRAGKTVDDVDHWVSNAPTPSFVDRALKVMGTDPRNGVNTNRLLGNIGPSLFGASLFYNAHLRGFQPGDLVLCCSVGSEASLAVALLEWPDSVALGDAPDHASLDAMRAFETERMATLAETEHGTVAQAS